MAHHVSLLSFVANQELPSAATFSRAFAEFAQSELAERAHEALIIEHLGDRIVGALSRDATAIEARERPRSQPEQAPTAAARPVAGAQRSLDLAKPPRCEKPARRGAPRRAGAARAMRYAGNAAYRWPR